MGCTDYGINWYSSHHYLDGKWWVSFNAGVPEWTGPFDIIIDKMNEMASIYWKANIHPGRALIKHVGNGRYKLTFSNIKE